MKRAALLLCAVWLFTGPFARGEADGEIYTMVDEENKKITMRYGKMYEGDEYISSKNDLYVIVSVDEEKKVAVAEHRGKEPSDAVSVLSADKKGPNKRILMYSTHSDESYIPGDGDFSLEKNAGIYDVGERFMEHLEKAGYEVEYSKETFLPHDAGAYRRSRAVAAEFAKKNPAALIDIHRDGIPAEEYETTVDGKKTSMVRLFVGKSNSNAAENRAFAKQLKAYADDEYPGLIKDIYIGKGNYNQDLYPNAILLEFGTHEIDKKLVMDSTEYMAKVLTNVLGEGEESKPAEDAKEGVRGGGKWILLAILGAGVFALFATGSLKGMGEKLKKGAGEITGGLFSGKKRKK